MRTEPNQEPQLGIGPLVTRGYTEIMPCRITFPSQAGRGPEVWTELPCRTSAMRTAPHTHNGTTGPTSGMQTVEFECRGLEHLGLRFAREGTI